jgi:hypothetical protein
VFRPLVLVTHGTRLAWRNWGSKERLSVCMNFMRAYPLGRIMLFDRHIAAILQYFALAGPVIG